MLHLKETQKIQGRQQLYTVRCARPTYSTLPLNLQECQCHQIFVALLLLIGEKGSTYCVERALSSLPPIARCCRVSPHPTFLPLKLPPPPPARKHPSYFHITSHPVLSQILIPPPPPPRPACSSAVISEPGPWGRAGTFVSPPDQSAARTETLNKKIGSAMDLSDRVSRGRLNVVKSVPA